MRALGLATLCLAAGIAATASAAAATTGASRSAGTPPAELSRWEERAANVEILRDRWGIAHVYGKSDADAVFGAIYAQAEDDFGRVERNYLTGLGWLAQAEGDGAVYADLRQRLFVDTERLKRLYRDSPAWLQALMSAWADGLNFYLQTHPRVKPKVITHFEPWMTLSFTEGSIGGDIESIDLAELQAFYDGRAASAAPAAADLSGPNRGALPVHEASPGGSNGFAIAPARSASGHALLWINPHTSFYFRSELEMTSESGLGVYGAVTWGQFFVYQGFNQFNGWMHTSYGGDAIDEYAESIVMRADGPWYRYGKGLRKLRATRIRIPVAHGDTVDTREFTVYHSHHGPIIRADGGKWIAIRLLQDPVPALSQSFLRTKTRDYASFLKIQGMRTDTSNNTVYADREGNIAYFHGNFIPRRDPSFDYAHPVDGSDPRTEWRGPHALDETIKLLNPKSGWIQNTNNWPFSAAGADSPRREEYPRYMWTKGENPRGIHAVQVLHDIRDVTLESLIAAGYDSRLTAFDVLLPPLLDAYDRLPAADVLRQRLREPIESLRNWDHRTAADSAPTALAIFWAQTLVDAKGAAARDADEPVFAYLLDQVTDAERLGALSAAVEELSRDFGRWQVAWGEVNRFQRRTDDIVQPFDDDEPSLPIGLAPAQWGALASFDSDKPRKTRRIYGSVGNSFVAAVEFGPTVRAKAIMAGGESGDPASMHFRDQAERYRSAQFRDIWFTRADVESHLERRYHPGEIAAAP